MLSKRKEWYRMFGLDNNNYKIDKNQLKTNYYKLTKSAHPDIGSHLCDKSTDISETNKAYGVLLNDFLRAKLFTKPSSRVDVDFLMKCLDLEDRIRSGEDMKDVISFEIEKCRENYDKPEWISKWAYFERLQKMVNEI